MGKLTELIEALTPVWRKGFTPEQRLILVKLDNKALRAFPSSPRQKAILAERDRLESEFTMKLSGVPSV
jgi:hypothetical protein